MEPGTGNDAPEESEDLKKLSKVRTVWMAWKGLDILDF